MITMVKLIVLTVESPLPLDQQIIIILCKHYVKLTNVTTKICIRKEMRDRECWDTKI